MAKKSLAALSVVPRLPGVVIGEPSDLSVAELALWRETVASKPAEWFGADSVPVLKEYVRAAVTCDLLDLKVKEVMDEGEVGEVKTVLDMRDKESKRVANLATKLRLTQQSRYTPQAAATADRHVSGRRPWQS
jgi:hypothetical protein